MNIIFTPASDLNLEALVAAFNAGYEGYIVPVNLNADQMQSHIMANSIDLYSSRVAWSGDDLVGIGLLGRRLSLGWIGGIGIVAGQRGQGIGRKLMDNLLQEAQRTGITRVYLEVIVSNTPAYKLYQSLGFETLRRLLIIGCDLVEGAAVTGIEVESVALQTAHTYIPIFQAGLKPWQRQNATGSAWVARQDGEVRAYIIGQVTPKRIVFNDAGGDASALTAIITHLHRENPNLGGSFVNLAEDDPAWPVFEALGYVERLAQYEMALNPL